jgi:putative phage-type endonuclease
MNAIKQLLAEQLTGIGGSEASAAIGLSKYRTPYELYKKKTLSEVQSDNNAMHWGRMLEPVIRNHYELVTGNKVQVTNNVFRHPKHDFMLAHVDGLTEDGIVEIKTAGAHTRSQWGEEGTDQVPLDYLIQCRHYMSVLGVEKADLAVLIGGQEFKLYTINRDLQFENFLIKKESEFWNCVQTKTPPLPTSLEEVTEFYSKSSGGSVIATDKIRANLRELTELSEKIKILEEEEKYLKSEILAFINNAEYLYDSDKKLLATWKNVDLAPRFNANSLKKDHPDLYNKYLENGKTTRRFLVK